jgi:hypothetical protein
MAMKAFPCGFGGGDAPIRAKNTLPKKFWAVNLASRALL